MPPVFDRVLDTRVRAAAFAWLSDQVARQGDVLPRDLLTRGFDLDGAQVRLLGPQGIFKPAILRAAPLSITTLPGGPYEDGFGPDGLLRYRYRGADPDHPDNRGLRFAAVNRLPLVYFYRIERGKYLATWPVFVVGDSPETLTFTMAVDDAGHSGLLDPPRAAHGVLQDDAEAARRAYVTAAVRVRLHQRAFRERVLNAYRRQCAFCRLRHEELLDAAHIVPDSEPGGEPAVSNGLSLCSLHHKAFDRYFLGVRPDFVIEVREDLLREHDGPTLVHAIQKLHGTSILLPHRSDLRPSPDRLAARYDRFCSGQLG